MISNHLTNTEYLLVRCCRIPWNTTFKEFSISASWQLILHCQSDATSHLIWLLVSLWQKRLQNSRMSFKTFNNILHEQSRQTYHLKPDFVISRVPPVCQSFGMRNQVSDDTFTVIARKWCCWRSWMTSLKYPKGQIWSRFCQSEAKIHIRMRCAIYLAKQNQLSWCRNAKLLESCVSWNTVPVQYSTRRYSIFVRWFEIICERCRHKVMMSCLENVCRQQLKPLDQDFLGSGSWRKIFLCKHAL
jgi:hypothetical protein